MSGCPTLSDSTPLFYKGLSGRCTRRKIGPSVMRESGDASSDVPTALSLMLNHQSSEIPMSANCLTGSQDKISTVT